MSGDDRLKLTSIVNDPFIQATIEFDHYAPLTIQFPRGASALGSFSFMRGDAIPMAEVSFDLESGRIVQMSLIGSAQSLGDQKANAIDLSQCSSAVGIPLLKDHGFPTDAILPSLRFDRACVFSCDTSIATVLFDAAPVDKILKWGRVLFLFSEDHLAGFGVDQVTAAERSSIFD